MKLLYLITCIIGLTGCQKNISDEALKKAQDNLAYDGAEQYLKKYDQKGSRDKVYENFNFNNEYFDVSPIVEASMFKCSHNLKIQKSDVKKEDGIFSYTPEFYVKKGTFVDYKAFNQCMDKQLNGVSLNFKNLQIFSNDPDVQKYKESDPLIGNLVMNAKADGEISYLEAINIYLAIYKQTEKDLFSNI
ncbi:MAG: hypothetical protein KBC72_02875 [Acinetobacter sp.]|nr:hypothetical protein [Acinetobacter sp.]